MTNSTLAKFTQLTVNEINVNKKHAATDFEKEIKMAVFKHGILLLSGILIVSKNNAV